MPLKVLIFDLDPRVAKSLGLPVEILDSLPFSALGYNEHLKGPRDATGQDQAEWIYVALDGTNQNQVVISDALVKPRNSLVIHAIKFSFIGNHLKYGFGANGLTITDANADFAISPINIAGAIPFEKTFYVPRLNVAGLIGGPGEGLQSTSPVAGGQVMRMEILRSLQ